jgi:hypothetical protein
MVVDFYIKITNKIYLFRVYLTIMTTKITVDPMETTPLNSALNPINPQISNPNQVMNVLQNMMQLQLMNNVMSNLSYIKTGNVVIDTLMATVVQGLIIGLVTYGISQLGTLLQWAKSNMSYIFTFTFGILWKLWYVFKTRILGIKERKKIFREVDVPYISDNRQINELYKAVFWYLTNNTEIDYVKEPYLQFLFDKKINLETKDKLKNNLNIHKILTQQKTKEIEFKNHKINYSLKTDLITVYTDKDRKRENYKVILSTYIDECEKNDILEQFCQHCLIEYINNFTATTWQQLIYTNKNGEWTSAPSNNTRKLDTIILKKGLKEDIKNDLQLFLNSEEWYKERDIPYTRGYLFYGYPGTGKTSMIKGLSLFCKRHIHYLMLSEVKSDSELIELFKKVNYKDTVLVIEDIDAMAEIVKSRELQNEIKKKKSNEEEIESSETKENDERKKKKQEYFVTNEKDFANHNTLTLSGLLNAIDGVFTCQGRILIMTTNHPEVLDSALIRPGRVDSKYLFENCNKDQIKGLYEMFFNRPSELEQIEQIRNENYSPSHITSVFLRYRNNPEEALLHLDDIETKVQIKPLVKIEDNSRVAI